MSEQASPNASTQDVDVVVVGAGFAGIYALYKLREAGLSSAVLEAGGGVGGTWYWNRYPGARCDIQSLEYSYQFSEELQQEWSWSERYSPQPEILAYANHVTDRFGLRDGIQFNTRVVSAVFDETSERWTVETDGGDTYSAQFCIMATGNLSAANVPNIEGLDSFKGDTYFTAQWPHEGVDFTGKRVGVVGTGSSGIQSIPLIAQEAEHLTVFQRTPNYSVPAGNRPLDAEEERRVKAEYAAFRARQREMPFGAFADIGVSGGLAREASAEERRARFEYRWEDGGLPFLASYGDLMFDNDSNELAAAFVREKMRAKLDDPAVAEMLIPDTAVGCKRLCADTDYLETFNRPNVSLRDVRKNPIERITPQGIVTGSEEVGLDAIVFATGFDAMTGALSRIDIRGRGGLPLTEKWAEGPKTYLGIGTVGFPNFFTVTGPGSPSVLSNMIPSIEQHVNWMTACIEHLRSEGLTTIEPKQEAEDAWVEQVNDVANLTLYPGCNSWYVGANVPGKPRVFMPYIGFPTYVAKCEEVVANGYEGFALGGPSAT
jgi:cation diffusion facilitator CzcD-associated flavoprotein CzcO